MLRTEELNAGYSGTAVLHNVSIEVADGELTAILGRNGVGKSTLLKTLIGSLVPTSGRIHLDNVDVTGMRAHDRARRGIAYVPQGRDIFPRLSVLDNLRVAAYACKAAGDWPDRLEQVFSEFPVLRDKRALPGGGLSGGQQQILALGRALMTNPKVLLLDEPSEGIQPSIVAQIADSIRRINAERGITVLLVEQNLDFAARACDEAYLMDKGEVARRIPVSELVQNRDLQHEYLGV